MSSDYTPRLLSPITRQKRLRPQGRLQPNPKAPLRQQVHEVMRFFHYSQRTEDTYWQWIVRFLRFHNLERRRIAVRDGKGDHASLDLRWRIAD